MESPSLFLCKGLLLTGEASPGVVWGGCSDRKGPWEDPLLQAERGGHGGTQAAQVDALREQGVLRGEEKPDPSLFKVTSANRTHGCALTLGVLTHYDGLLPTRDFPGHSTQRTTNALGQIQAPVFVPIKGSGMGVRALMLSCEVCLGGSAGDRAVLGLLTQKRQAMGVERGWRRAWDSTEDMAVSSL